MKKYILGFLFVMCFLFLQSNVFAYQNEQNGFENFYWGETIEEIQKDYEVKLIANRNGINEYIINYPKPIYNKNPQNNKIRASFYEGKLYALNIIFIDNRNNEVYTALYKDLTSNFGEPTSIDFASYSDGQFYSMTNISNIRGFDWKGSRTDINVNSNKNNISIIVKDTYTETRIREDIRQAQMIENIMKIMMFIVLLIILSIIIWKVVKKYENSRGLKFLNKYFLLGTNALFAIYLLYIVANERATQVIIMFLVTIYNIYGISSKIRSIFYMWIYFIFNIAFLLIVPTIPNRIINGDFKTILIGIEVINLVVSIFWFKKLLKVKSENRE